MARAASTLLLLIQPTRHSAEHQRQRRAAEPPYAGRSSRRRHAGCLPSAYSRSRLPVRRPEKVEEARWEAGKGAVVTKVQKKKGTRQRCR